LGLTAVASLEYGDKNIRVNAVGPGVMKTPAMHNTLEENPRHIEFLNSLSPMGRFADPAEVAKAAVWLCTDEASSVTGHTLVADGGASAGKFFKNVV
jgi:NAD(P)-dependent dehydrogenase (short-subunit alcohol dehydrogenase family)